MEDPERDQRRAVRRRRRARLRAAELGRSRGGLASKVHLAVERRCRPLSIILTPGQAADSPRFIPVLKKIKVRGRVGRPRTSRDPNSEQALVVPHQATFALSPSSGACVVAISRFVISSAVSTSAKPFRRTASSGSWRDSSSVAVVSDPKTTL